MSEQTEEALDAKRYRCIRCKAPADVIFKMLPYCIPHEPSESKLSRQPKEEVKMAEITKTTEPAKSDAVQTEPEAAAAAAEDVGGGWVVRAKDGTKLQDGFSSKKGASEWASLEVKAKRLKAGQYKIGK